MVLDEKDIELLAVQIGAIVGADVKELVSARLQTEQKSTKIYIEAALTDIKNYLVNTIQPQIKLMSDTLDLLRRELELNSKEVDLLYKRIEEHETKIEELDKWRYDHDTRLRGTVWDKDSDIRR